jgi:hypothetical protein
MSLDKEIDEYLDGNNLWRADWPIAASLLERASEAIAPIVACDVCAGDAPWIVDKNHGYNFCPRCGRKLRAD